MPREIVIHYEKHQGILDIFTNKVLFYGMYFPTMSDAVLYLKSLPKDTEFMGWFHDKTHGVLNTKTGEVFLDGRWLPSETFAEQYIDQKKISNKY